MNAMARISFDRGELVIPAHSDGELIVQVAESSARRHGRVKLELRRQQLPIGFPPDGSESACDRCSQRLRMMVTVGTTQLCVRCARERVC